MCTPNIHFHDIIRKFPEMSLVIERISGDSKTSSNYLI